MNRSWVSLCALLFVTPVLAQDAPKPPLPSVPTASQASGSEKPDSSNYSQEPFIIEQYSTMMRYENDGTGVQDTIVRARVQSEAGVQQLGELTFGYNSANDKIDVRYVRVHRADGTVAT